jgi:uncharacterized membrane protein
MTKHDFMAQLAQALGPLKPEERQDILADFEEHFQNGLAGGKSEEEVAAELGDPATLAAQYTEGLPAAPTPVGPGDVARGVLAALGLLLFDVIIALPVIGTLLGLWLGLWGVVVGLLGGSAACFAAPFFSWIPVAPPITIVGIVAMGIAMLALSVLAAIGMVYVTKGFFHGLLAYVRMHIRIIGGSTK